MEKISEKATFVIANYIFNDANLFSTELESSEKFKSNNSDFEKVKLQSNILLPENFPMPLAIYKNKNSQIMYSVGDARLDISSSDYEEAKERLKNLLLTLAQFKLQEISAIGINYNAGCKTNKRLAIFNKEISDGTFSNWSKNIGFTLSIPLDLKDLYNCVATYTIKKISGETNSQGDIVEPYVYNISVNYNFKIDEDKADTMKRYNKLESIVNSIENLYKDFNKKCSEITSL